MRRPVISTLEKWIICSQAPFEEPVASGDAQGHRPSLSHHQSLALGSIRLINAATIGPASSITSAE